MTNRRRVCYSGNTRQPGKKTMSMTVAELLKDKALQASGSMLFSIAPGAPVSAAVSLMVQKSISSVLVLDGDTMLGLITLRELLAGVRCPDDRLPWTTFGQLTQ